jgi:phosphatidylglycerophosphate synthase
LLFEYIEFRPSILGKIVTFFQMVTVISVLLRFEYSYIIWTTTAIFTILSGVHYLIRTNRIISEKAKRIV